MMTQKEQLTKARNAYIVPLNPTETRFAVYLDNLDEETGELACLWPSDSHEGKKSKELLHGQFYGTRKSAPAYHFHLTGYGYSKVFEIAGTLTRINPALRVHSLRPGWAPRFEKGGKP